MSEAYTSTIERLLLLGSQRPVFHHGPLRSWHAERLARLRRRRWPCLSGLSSDPIALAVCESEATECATPPGGGLLVDTPRGRINERRGGLREVVVQTVNVANGQTFMQLLALLFTRRYSHAVLTPHFRTSQLEELNLLITPPRLHPLLQAGGRCRLHVPHVEPQTKRHRTVAGNVLAPYAR